MDDRQMDNTKIIAYIAVVVIALCGIALTVVILTVSFVNAI